MDQTIPTTSTHRPLFCGFGCDSGDLEPLDDVAKLELLGRVREGDSDAIQRMILSHIRLIGVVVNSYTPTYRYYVSDLDSIAMLELVTVVNSIAAGKMANHDNITGFILVKLKSKIAREIGNSYIVPTPRKKKTTLTETLIKAVPGRDSQLNNQSVDIWDSVVSLAQNQLEKQILELRGEGHTDAEVAEYLDVSRPTVRRIRVNLFRKYKQKEEKS